MTLLALVATTVGVLSASSAAIAQTPSVPGAPNITSVTAGDRQLSVNWSAATTPADRPIIDYQVMYREGNSGAWSMASSFSLSYDSDVQTGSDTTWAHDRDPLDLGTVTGGAAPYIERTNGGRHSLAGIYRVKADVAAVRIRVAGDATSAATIRAGYTTSPITDLRHNGTELARVTQSATQSGFQLAGVTPALSPNSYIWIDGWDHTSTNTKVPEFEGVTIGSRRLRIDIATVSTATNTTIVDLTNERSYQVRVRARNSAGWGAWSNVSSGTPQGTPDAPTGLELESGASKLIARWSAPSNDGGNDVTDYDIHYRVESSGANWTDWQESTVSTATATTITGLTNGTKYEVRVRAVNSAGDGLWTGSVINTTGKPSPPSFTLSAVRRPLPPGGYDRGGLLSLTLTAAANGSAVTDYDVRYRESGTSTWFTYRDRSLDSGKLTDSEASGTADPIDFGTFTSPSGAVAVTRESIGTNAGVYKFSKAVDQLWVRASGTITGGGTVVARWHTSKPTAANLATAGTQVFSAATESDNTFWQDGWVVDLPANAYVWLHTNATETLTKRRVSFDFTGNSTSGSMVLSGLRNGTTYELQARAKNARGWGSWGSASGTTGTPMRPGVDTPTAKHQSLAVTWARPASDNQSAVTDYDVRYRAGSSGEWTSWTHNGTTRSTTITGLTNNTEYEVQVRAINGRGNGFWSASVKATPAPQVPAAPAAPALTSSGTTMTATWSAPLANGADITDYNIQYRPDTSGADWIDWQASTTSTATTATITNLTSGTTYEVRVRARNSVGGGPWSTASTHTLGRPSAPMPPTLKTGDEQLTATWTAASDNGSTITDYHIQYRPDTSGADWIDWQASTISTATTATITGLANGTTYQVQVSAQNARGIGPWSTAVSIMVGLPAAPGTPTVVAGDEQLTVSWAAAADNGSTIFDYDVRYCSANCESGDAYWQEHSPLRHWPHTHATLYELTNGTTYKVRLRAVNQHGSGLWSPTVTAVPGVPAAPAAPVLTAADHKIIVNWSAPADNGAEISDYDVQYSSDGGTTWVELNASTTSTATEALIAGLTPLTTYRVQARAENANGTGAWSASSTMTLPVSPVPDLTYRACDPAGLTQLWVDYACYIKAGERGIKDFDTVTITGSGSNYVEKSEYQSAGVVELAEILAYNPQGGLAIVETSLDGAVQDRFLIDVIRFGIRSYELTGTLKAHQYAYLTVKLHSPDHGSNKKYMVNGVDFARSWVQLSLPNQVVAQDHNELWSTSPIKVVDQYGDSVTFRLFPTQGGDYEIRIDASRPAPDASCPRQGPLRCFDPPVESKKQPYIVSAPLMANASVGPLALATVPGTPSSVSVSRANGTLTATWPAVDGASNYHVTYSPDNGASWSLGALTHLENSITINNVVNSSTYIVGVRARNGSSGSGWRNSPPAGPYVPQPPATPSSVSVSRTDGTLTATWPAVDGATSYHITYTSDNGASWSLAALDHPQNSITINNVANGSTHIVGVRARNADGGSSWRNSSPAGPFVPQPPATPSSVSVIRGDGTLTATWAAIDEATSYHITYSSDYGASWSLGAFDHPSNSITINNVANSSTYIVGVRARNSAGGSGWCNSPPTGPYVP